MKQSGARPYLVMIYMIYFSRF